MFLRNSPGEPPPMRQRIVPILLCVAVILPLGRPPRSPPATCTRNSGLILPDGFCAIVVATRLGPVRQIAVAPNGDVYAALQDGGIVVLRDVNDDGVADQKKAFFDDGGTGI